MTLGQRIRAARMEAGLSQRELAGEEITRNMLSALEHDAANPSVATLCYLARRLGKPVSWFLGEDGPAVDGWEALRDARAAFDSGAYRHVRELLKGEPGEALAREWHFLNALSLLREAEDAIRQGRLPYARELLGKPGPFPLPELERKAMLLRFLCGCSTALPEDDTLLLRAEGALADGRSADAERYLLALDDRDERWNYLMGESLFSRGAYKKAAEHFHRCEDAMDVRGRLEVCYRELEDYKLAYYYAKK